MFLLNKLVLNFIGNNIKYLRKVFGITQNNLAKQIGTNRSNVGAWEEKRANPSPDHLILIAKVFSISVDSLISVSISDNPQLISKPNDTNEKAPNQVNDENSFYGGRKINDEKGENGSLIIKCHEDEIYIIHKLGNQLKADLISKMHYGTFEDRISDLENNVKQIKIILNQLNKKLKTNPND